MSFSPIVLLAPTQPVHSLLLSNLLPDILIDLPLILEKIPRTPQNIDPWLILNYPDILLLIINWFSLLTPDLLLTTTNLVLVLLLFSLVFCYQIFLWFSKNPLHFHSTTDKPLVEPHLPWSFTIDYQFIFIFDPISIATTYSIPGLLLSSLVFFYQIFLWFSKNCPALALHNW